MELQTPKISTPWSAIVRYAVVSAINLAILLVGITLGVMLAPHIEKSADAAEPQASQMPAAPAGQKLTPVRPSMTTGTIGIYLILAHHIQSDELVVNGYDLLKLQNSELQMLSRFVPAAEIQRAVEDAKTGEMYTVAQPTPPPATQPNKSPQK
jgi:hypothetical protein